MNSGGEDPGAGPWWKILQPCATRRYSRAMTGYSLWAPQKIRISSPIPDLLSQNLQLNKILRWLVCTLKLEKNWSICHKLTSWNKPRYTSNDTSSKGESVSFQFTTSPTPRCPSCWFMEDSSFPLSLRFYGLLLSWESSALSSLPALSMICKHT